MTLTAEMIADILHGETDPRSVSPDLPERFEVVNGQLVESPDTSAYANEAANRLNHAVIRHLIADDRGVTSIEQLYHIPQAEDAGRNRRLDFAFVSYERWSRNRPWSFRGNARDVVPDLVAEIVSPTDPADELIAKVREYLRGGVRLVWVVYPLAREVHAYRPGSDAIRAHFADGDLDAPEVLPGFRTRVGDLFPPVEPPPA